MQLENTIPHPNYKRVIWTITILFLVGILGGLLYQYTLTKKAEKIAAQQALIQHQQELIEQSKAYFAGLPPRTQETADKDRNASKEFFKNLQTK